MTDKNFSPLPAINATTKIVISASGEKACIYGFPSVSSPPVTDNIYRKIMVTTSGGIPTLVSGACEQNSVKLDK